MRYVLHSSIENPVHRTSSYILTFYSSNATYFSSFSRESFVRCARKKRKRGKRKKEEVRTYKDVMQEAALEKEKADVMRKIREQQQEASENGQPLS